MNAANQNGEKDEEEGSSKQMQTQFRNLRIYTNDSDTESESDDIKPESIPSRIPVNSTITPVNYTDIYNNPYNVRGDAPSKGDVNYFNNPFNYNAYSLSNERHLPNVYRAHRLSDSDSDDNIPYERPFGNMHQHQPRTEGYNSDDDDGGELATFMRRHNVIAKTSLSHALLTRTQLPQDVFSPREFRGGYPFGVPFLTERRNLEELEEADMKKAIELSLEELAKNAKREEERLKEEKMKEEIRKNYEDELQRKQQELAVSDDSGEEDGDDDDNFYYEEPDVNDEEEGVEDDDVED